MVLETYLWSYCQFHSLMVPCNIIQLHLNLFPHTYALLWLCCRQLLKTLWQKEKLLIMSNFSFCHNVFNSFQLLCFHYRKLSSAADLLYVGKGLSCRHYICKSYVHLLLTVKLHIIVHWSPVRDCWEVNGIDSKDSLNPLPHTTSLQQRTFKTSKQKYGKSL